MGEEPSKTPRFIAQSALRKNSIINQHSTISVYAFSGATAGIIGLNGWSGFIFFILSGFLLIGLLQLKSGFNWIKYFPDYSNLQSIGWMTGIVLKYLSYVRSKNSQ